MSMLPKSTKSLKAKEQGFTIVELMVALAILSVILIISTVVMIQIGALYSKGVNAADLQNANRTVVADLSAQLQFSGKVPNGCTLNDPDNTPPLDADSTTCYANKIDNAFGSNATVYSYCISNVRYTYILDRELGTDSSLTPSQTTPHVLWRDTLETDATSCPVADIVTGDHLNDAPSTGDGYEMLGNHMRLTRFKITQVGSSNIYNVDVWMAFGDSDLVQPDPAGPVGHSICSGATGTQFCSVSSISTQLTGRLY